MPKGSNRYVFAVPLLLVLASCGGDSNTVTPTATHSDIPSTPAIDVAGTPEADGTATLDAVGSTLTRELSPTAAVAATGTPVAFPRSAESTPELTASPAVGTNLIRGEGTPVSSPEPVEPTLEVARSPSGGIQLIGGAGTPASGEAIAKGVPTPDSPDVGYTPIPSSYDSDGDGFLTSTDLIAALLIEYPFYDWPPGYQLDLDAVIASIEEETELFNTIYENGIENNYLGLPYICAWQLTLRDAIFASDDVLTARSLERLRAEVASNPSLTEIRQYYEDAFDKAELGDPGPLQQRIDAGSCATVPWRAELGKSRMTFEQVVSSALSGECAVDKIRHGDSAWSSATDRVATGTQTTNPNEAGTASAVDSDTEFELIGGPGTPLPEDLIVEKDVPTPDGPVTGYTPISSTYDSDDDGFLTGADLVTALRAEYPKYSWPPDYQLDLDAFIVVINEEVEKYNTLYENGMERSMLTRTNLCAWQLDLRDAMYSGDEERIAADIALLRSILSSTSAAFDDIRPYQEDAINKAELGDPGPLQQMIEGAFCEERLWIAAPDADSSTGRIGVAAILREGFNEMV